MIFDIYILFFTLFYFIPLKLFLKMEEEEKGERYENSGIISEEEDDIIEEYEEEIVKKEEEKKGKKKVIMDEMEIEELEKENKKKIEEEKKIREELEIEDSFEEKDSKEKKKDNKLEENEEDYIIKSYDISLSHKLIESLYLLQYPLRGTSMSYDFDSLKSVNFKPIHKKMNMEFEINDKTDNFDNDSIFASKKNFMLSSKQLQLKANYCIGVLRGGKPKNNKDQFHITPLKNILQLRPNLDYLSEEISQKVVTKQKNEKKKEPKLIHQTITTKQDEISIKRSYEYLYQKEEQEEFKKLKFFKKGQLESDKKAEKLFQESSKIVNFDLNFNKYIDSLIPLKVDPMEGVKGNF
jgi:hypothetical protein